MHCMWLRGLLRLWCALVLAIGFGSLVGCSAPVLHIRLPGFYSGQVDGVWLWKRLASGAYQRVCRIDISDPYTQGGQEIVEYQLSCLDGRPQAPLWYALVERLPSNYSTATLKLLIGSNGPPLTHKASSFNGAGESALSATTAQL